MGRVADEVASDEDVTDSAVDDPVEKDSAAVDDRVEVTCCDVVSARGDDTLDGVPAGVDDGARSQHLKREYPQRLLKSPATIQMIQPRYPGRMSAMVWKRPRASS